jgi:hypothetical protein
MGFNLVFKGLIGSKFLVDGDFIYSNSFLKSAKLKVMIKGTPWR